MKKSAFIVTGLIFLLAVSGVGFGMDLNAQSPSFVSQNEKVTAEQAKKLALKRVEGTVEDEYTFENDEGEVETYVFIIKTKEKKVFEVQVGAENGDIVSVEEYTDDETTEDTSEDPPVFR